MRWYKGDAHYAGKAIGAIESRLRIAYTPIIFLQKSSICMMIEVTELIKYTCVGFTPEEEALIEKTFRLYIHRCIEGNQRGGIGNWNIADITGAIYCALALQDFNLLETLMEMPTGINAQISHGVIGDGWWYECSVGYNLWVAVEFSEIAITLEPWGENLKDKQFPIGTTSHYSLEPDRRRPGLYGMNFDKWGKLETNSIGFKRYVGCCSAIS